MDSQTIRQARQRAPVVPRARTAGTAPDGTPWNARISQRAPQRDPGPRPRRLVGLCTWAALLGFLGLAVGVRGVIAILVKAPHWYEPTLITLGLAGIATAAVAMLTVRYHLYPWLFLALSSGILLASILATAAATAG